MISFKLILGVLFVLLIGAITILGVVSYLNGKQSNETAQLVKRTYEVLEVADEIAGLYKDIQLESNAFFISRDSAIVGPYLSARKSLLPLIDRLRDVTSDDSAQQLRVDTLRSQIGRLSIFTDSVLNSSTGGGKSEAIGYRIMTNTEFRSKIRGVIGAIKAEEKRLLVMREAANIHSVAAFNRTFFLLIGGIGLLLCTTFFSIRYNFNKRIVAQEQLKNANELFVKLFYESPIGIVISRLDTGEIMDCNKAYAELIGYNKSELIGKTAVQLGILPSTERRNTIIGEARTTGTVKDIEVQLKPKDCEPIWVSISMQTILVNNESCLLSAILDMTVHREAEEKIKNTLTAQIELNKLKSNFVTLASHEFRTPLTTILSSAFLLDNYAVGGNKEKIGKHVSRIKASVNLLTSILDEFLSLTKIEEGKIEPKFEKLNIKQGLESLCLNLKALAKPGQQILFQHTGEEEVYSDPVLLGNIVNNLVSNAIKYSSHNTNILVSAAVNSKIHLSVKDHGIGISKEDQAHLFERFFRASSAGNIQGAGLGLHIMKHYLDLLGGSIQVISEPGKGSEFQLTLDHIRTEGDVS
jgi:PAS domain S-box-containing protein